MRLDEIPFKGRFEEEMPPEFQLPLQLLVPENELEQELICWSLMRHPESVEDASAPGGTVFHYEPLGHRRAGLFGLRITARHGGSRNPQWEVELGAVMAVGAGDGLTHRMRSFVPLWIMDRHLHWKASQKMVDDRFGGPACGRLDFSGTENLPHRRLLSPADVGAQ